jgi:hypothetical protein
MREPTDALVDRVRELYLRPEEEWRRTAILEGITQLTADLARLRAEREALLEGLQRIATLTINLKDHSAVTMARFAANTLAGRKYFEDAARADHDGTAG